MSTHNAKRFLSIDKITIKPANVTDACVKKIFHAPVIPHQILFRAVATVESFAQTILPPRLGIEVRNRARTHDIKIHNNKTWHKTLKTYKSVSLLRRYKSE